MMSERAENAIFVISILAITIAMVAPIWSVEQFILQDASGHVNTSFVMAELLKGNTFFSGFYEFNSPFVPNSSGHWLMVLLLQVFSPFVVTKIMTSLTLVAVPLSVVWFNRQVSGSGGETTAFLIGCAVAFNWFWLLGAFNFMLGFAGFVFTLGLFWRWREAMTWNRSLTLMLLVSFIFYTHLVGFLILTNSIFIIALFARNDSRKRNFFRILPIVLFALILFLLHKIQMSTGGEASYPDWRSLSDPYSLRSWLSQLVAVDPFVLISRKTLPFTTYDSSLLSIFSPIVWMTVGVVLYAAATLLDARGRKLLATERIPFLLLAAGTMVVALFGPDDFNMSNGGLLRQRLFMAAFVFLVPLLTMAAGKLRLMAHGCFLFVLIFQTATMWEFVFYSNAQTHGFIEAGHQIPGELHIASTVILEERPRFHAVPAPQMINYLGTGRNLIVVDNYAFGYNLFAIVTRDAEMRKFIRAYSAVNVLYPNNAHEDFTNNLNQLDFYLADNSGRIDVMLLYGRNDAVEKVLGKTFDPQPFYESGSVRLYRRRN